MNSLTLYKLLLKVEFFEITKKFKEFKFEQNLRVEFTKKKDIFRKDYLKTHGLIEFSNINIHEVC